MLTTLLAFILLVTPHALAKDLVKMDDILKEIKSGPINLPTPEAFDIKKFLNGYGYPFEAHEVVTQDGYILGIHRIPHGRHENNTKFTTTGKPAILLMHGLDCSSIDFLILGPNRSLPLMFADQGYDVWLGNNRGNTWSRKHISLDPNKDKAFWDYSFHELGTYDTPATVDYIIKTTGNEKISYVAHSQGSTQFFVMVSTMPKYNDKIDIMCGMAPTIFMQNLRNPIIQVLKDYFTAFELATKYFNITEILPHSGFLTRVIRSFCKILDYQETCIAFFFIILGFDPDQLNREEFALFLDNFPAGTSLKEYKHFLQEVKSGHFRQYDYGWMRNLMKYKNMVPPDYDLSTIRVPIALYYGNNDLLVGTPDVDRLAEALPNVIKKDLIPYDDFNHGDFIIAKDVVSLLYTDLINIVNIYSRLDGPVTTTLSSSAPPTKSTASTEQWTTMLIPASTSFSSSTTLHQTSLFSSVIILIKFLL